MIFIFQYLNTGVILVAVNSDMYPDLYTNWYTDVGSTIVLLVIVLAFMPLISFLLSYIRIFFCRWYDRGLFYCCNKEHRTKKKTVQQYLDLYSGPEMQINYRYAIIMNMVFVTFSHGIAMPILFPICFCGILV